MIRTNHRCSRRSSSTPRTPRTPDAASSPLSDACAAAAQQPPHESFPPFYTCTIFVTAPHSVIGKMGADGLGGRVLVSRPRPRQLVIVVVVVATFVTLLRLTWPAPTVVAVPPGRPPTADHLAHTPSTAAAGHAAPSPVTTASTADASAAAQGAGGSSGSHVRAGPDPPAAQAGHGRPPLRVGLLMLIVDRFPPWWPYLVATYARNAPEYTLLAMHTADSYSPPRGMPVDDSHIRYVHLPLEEVRRRTGGNASETQRARPHAHGRACGARRCARASWPSSARRRRRRRLSLRPAKASQT